MLVTDKHKHKNLRNTGQCHLSNNNISHEVRSAVHKYGLLVRYDTDCSYMYLWSSIKSWNKLNLSLRFYDGDHGTTTASLPSKISQWLRDFQNRSKKCQFFREITLLHVRENFNSITKAHLWNPYEAIMFVFFAKHHTAIYRALME